MSDGRLNTAINQLRQVVGEQSGCTLTDAQLLNAFVTRRDETSFEVLVWRHGSMVLNLCRRILHDGHEAEDAFQATFLVFARKAGSIGTGTAVGSWLYKVAYRIALRLRDKTGRQNLRNDPLDDLPAPETVDEVLWNDLRPVLDEEIGRLPDKYRVPFVLCYLEGRTNEEAAREIGCPKGTILSRLSRGRDWLRARLVKRGVALSASALTLTLFQNTGSAAVPATLVASTSQAATSFAVGKSVMGAVSASVVSLSEGVLHTMFMIKLKFTAAALLAFAVIGTGTGWLTHEALAQRNADAKAEVDRGERAPVKAPDASGKVVAVAKDGKSFTIEVPAQNRGDEPTKAEFKIDDKTVIHYNAVASNGAKPTEGYNAQVRLNDGSKDTAASVTFHGSQNFRQFDLTGKILSVGKDGKSIKVEESARGRNEDGKSIDITITDKTQVSFSNIGKDGAKLAEGLMARVWFTNGSKDTADSLQVVGTEHVEERGGPQADIFGKVAAVAKDGKGLTVLIPAGRGEEPTKTEVRLSDKTTVVYNNVGVDGAKIIEGQMVRIWLENGSKDTAGKASITAQLQDRNTQHHGKVLSVGKDGKSFTLEIQPKGRTEDAKTLEVKMFDSTRICYFAVGPDEAKPAEGMMAHVRFEEGSTSNALQVQFFKGGGDRGGR